MLQTITDLVQSAAILGVHIALYYQYRSIKAHQRHLASHGRRLDLLTAAFNRKDSTK